MSQAADILSALGGWDNIETIEACITRIRAEVTDEDKINEKALSDAGAFGVVTVANSVQVVMGPETETIVEEIEKLK